MFIPFTLSGFMLFVQWLFVEKYVAVSVNSHYCFPNIRNSIAQKSVGFEAQLTSCNQPESKNLQL